MVEHGGAEAADVVSLELQITGRVQGVGYRATVQRWALESGVRGWVRNEPDGSVRALVQHAEQSVLDELIRRMTVGPPGSAVERIFALPADGSPLCEGFEIRV